MPELFHRVTGQKKVVTDSEVKPLKMSSPGVWTESLRAPIGPEDWGKMTASERLASSMVRERILAEGKTP